MRRRVNGCASRIVVAAACVRGESLFGSVAKREAGRENGDIFEIRHIAHGFECAGIQKRDGKNGGIQKQAMIAQSPAGSDMIFHALRFSGCRGIIGEMPRAKFGNRGSTYGF